jgi:hypothetical protein
VPKISFHCKYCGHQWIDILYSMPSTPSIRCPVCTDLNLIVKPVESGDIFGYNIEDHNEKIAKDRKRSQEKKAAEEKAKKAKEEADTRYNSYGWID